HVTSPNHCTEEPKFTVGISHTDSKKRFLSLPLVVVSCRASLRAFNKSFEFYLCLTGISGPQNHLTNSD
ncbi:hypothetical protein AMECASPLE_027398, partial [Ameca splendens]